MSTCGTKCRPSLCFENLESAKTARLLDLVPGRSGQAYKSWLTDRGQAFRDGVQIATLDPFRVYKNAIDDQLDDARAVLDAFYADVRVMPMSWRAALRGRGFGSTRSA